MLCLLQSKIKLHYRVFMKAYFNVGIESNSYGHYQNLVIDSKLKKYIDFYFIEQILDILLLQYEYSR